VVIEADAIWIRWRNGYYLLIITALVARNSSIPMVFGASGVTVLTPNSW
jgi:hypothetical protein